MSDNYGYGMSNGMSENEKYFDGKGGYAGHTKCDSFPMEGYGTNMTGVGLEGGINFRADIRGMGGMGGNDGADDVK